MPTRPQRKNAIAWVIAAAVLLTASCSSSVTTGAVSESQQADEAVLAQPSVPEPSVAEPSVAEPSVAEPSADVPAVEPTAAPASGVGEASADEASADEASADETGPLGITLWFPYEGASYDDFLALDATERVIEVPHEVSERELLTRTMQAWLDGPTVVELDQGFIDPFPVFQRGDGCDRDFDLELAQDGGLVLVTLCGSAPSAGVGANARAIASFERTIGDAADVRAALLNQGGHWCYASLNDYDPLRCLAESSGCMGDDFPLYGTALVVGITADDPDGGLVTHSAPGVDAPVVGLLPRGAIDIAVTGRCQVVEDGARWWEVVDDGSRAWANANWLQSTYRNDPSAYDDSCLVRDAPSLPLTTEDSLGAPVVHDHVVEMTVDDRSACRTVTLILGENFVIEEQTGEASAALAAGIEIEREADHLAIRFPSGPGEFELSNFFNSQQVFFGEGESVGAAFVSLADEHDGAEVIVVTGSDSPPQVTFGTNPARIEVTTFTNPPWRPTLIVGDARPSFVVPEIGQTGPGQVTASGWGIAFESSGRAHIIDETGTVVDTAEFVDVRVQYSTTGSLNFRTGNPGVSWAPFVVEASNLAPGDYRLVLDPCDQCDPVDPATGIAFTITNW